MLLKLVLRNAFRHKLRSLLTISGLCVAILAFALLRTVISAWYAGVEASSANRLITRNSISLVFPLPLSYRDKIRQIDGVKTVSYGNWFGGYYIDRKNFFANFAVDPESYLSLYPEYLLPNDQEQAFYRDRKSCVVGRKLAKRFGWKIGDTITLIGTIFPGKWDFVLRGIYRGRDDTIDENQFFFHWDYINETLKKTAPRRADQVGFYIVGITSPELAAKTAEAIDGTFKNSRAETLTETEKAFQMSFVSMSEAIITAIRLVSFVVIVIILVVVANTMVMSVRERAGEYAVFKTLGFGSFYLAGLIFGESLLIAGLGGAAGIVLTFPAAKAFAAAVGNWFPVFKVEALTLYLAVAAALVVGIAAAVIPIWRVVTVRVVEGLGRIE
ncbi:MAG: FtsX-like permease family protein [Deltaproteobacteria bacterium]|nr:FtsX-like permease family protein [Deltaproteobacteria bacterium]